MAALLNRQFFRIVCNRGYACAMIVHTQVLIFCLHIVHLHEDNLYLKSIFDKIAAM